MKQLESTAKQEEANQDEAAQRCHGFEYAAGALEIAIVLATASVVARNRNMTYIAAAIGGVAAAASAGIAANPL